MPKFRDRTTWHQAELLMQPTFIRLIDNIRKHLDASTWKGTYEDVLVWPEGISEADKIQVMTLRNQLEAASPEETERLEQALADLPSPFPGYQLCLEQGEQKTCVDLWELCYQICFTNYDPVSGTSHLVDQAIGAGVEVDTSLFEEDGEVDWNRLDEKAQRVVAQVFAEL